MAQDPYYNEGLMNEHEGAPDILAIGDSWFWYPGWNLLWGINHALKKKHVVFAYGENGANAQDWTKSSFRKQWSSGVKTYSPRMKLLLLSGGGNDFAGVPDFNDIIRFDCSAATTVDACWVDGEPGALFTRVQRAYQRVIETSRDCSYDGPVLVHNYDYAHPTGKGFAGPSNWLKVPMDQAKVRHGCAFRS